MLPPLPCLVSAARAAHCLRDCGAPLQPALLPTLMPVLDSRMHRATTDVFAWRLDFNLDMSLLARDHGDGPTLSLSPYSGTMT